MRCASKVFTLILTSVLLSGGVVSGRTAAGLDEAESRRLAAVLQDQPEKNKLRFSQRHPAETLSFFGIKPGMTVVEVLPGGGWYTKILLPYLGKEGRLIGADYAQDMWPHFSFASEQFIERKRIWIDTWTRDTESFRTDDSASLAAFQFGEMPDAMKGTADAVLLIRALHNLNRHRAKGDYLSEALQETYEILKPGGIVGIVQHQALEDRPDEWADGNAGYLKKSFVIKVMKDHGFEFVAESDVNANPKDTAGPGDIVWRLPPSLRGSDGDDTKRAAMVEIGESRRMTLKFRKPAK